MGTPKQAHLESRAQAGWATIFTTTTPSPNTTLPPPSHPPLSQQHPLFEDRTGIIQTAKMVRLDAGRRPPRASPRSPR